MTAHDNADAHDPAAEFGVVRCYVCSADLTGRLASSKSERPEKDGERRKKKEKEKLDPGLVEIRSEGTGFAGGGTNMVKREGIAFQC